MDPEVTHAFMYRLRDWLREQPEVQSAEVDTSGLVALLSDADLIVTITEKLV